MKQITFKSFDGTTLACYIWEDVTTPKGIVQIIHGMSEHAQRYNDLAKFLNQYGYIVFADDHRAHGQTAGSPQMVGKYDKPTNLYLDTVRDEIEISKHLKQTYPNLPLFVFGHSYGSLITQKYIQDCDLHKGAILCGTSYMNTFENKMAKTVAGITKKVKGNNANAKFIENLSFKKYGKGVPADELWITHNKEVVKEYKADPYCGNPFSAKFYYDLMSGVIPTYKKANLKKIDKRKPLMLISGALDAFSKNSKLVRKLYEKYRSLGIIDLTIHIYPNMRHEVHNEINNARVYADIKNFLNEHI